MLRPHLTAWLWGHLGEQSVYFDSVELMIKNVVLFFLFFFFFLYFFQRHGSTVHKQFLYGATPQTFYVSGQVRTLVISEI